MHDYAVDAGIRRKVNEIILVFYVLGASLLTKMNEMIEALFQKLVERCLGSQMAGPGWVYIYAVISILLPAIEIGLFYLIYDRWLWKCKCLIKLHKIPNLNGKWEAQIDSPLKGSYKPKIRMEIKQNWNKIRVTGISDRGTMTLSESASILEKHGQMYFSYSYWIHQEKGQCYPGFNSLRITEDGMRGRYFSAKNIEKDMERSCLHMIGEDETKRQILERIEGCGSKGMIVLKRVGK